MRVSVFGLGYVGAVSAACLAADGHTVVGVDTSETKVALLNAGTSPIVEKDVDELISKARGAGRLSATGSATEAIAATEISLICVGTPSEANGGLKLDYVRGVCAEIGGALKTLNRFHTIVVRSTILPGTMRSVVIPTLEAHSGLEAEKDFGVCFNPEFLREGTAVADHYSPPKTVVGEQGTRAGDALLELYSAVKASIFRTSIETAEMVKYVDNAWHALKVGFANEIGSICKNLNIDSFDVMHIFCQDTKLNLSPYYLRPGFAFGGSCLPKDVRALRYRARTLDVETPIINSILRSNESHVQRGFEMITRQGLRKVGILGFSFKAGTDDLRESPLVEIVERLLGKGYELRLYDRNVNIARLVGANRDYILNHIPHIASLMRDDIDAVLEHAELIVIGNSAPEFSGVPSRLRPGQRVVDLVRIDKGLRTHDLYEGICW